jgi:hypothetical protein
MTLVEEAYQRGLDAMTPIERIARVEGFLCWTRNLMARQVRAQLGPEVSDERIRWEVALRMYGSSPRMAALIPEQIARVSS